MARYRITVRGDGCELRGELTAGSHRLSEFAAALQPFGLVVASEVESDDANLEDWNKEKQAKLEEIGQSYLTGEQDLDLTLERMRVFQASLREEGHG